MSRRQTYEIQVQGRIGERWAQWFEDLTVRSQGDEGNATTTLTGNVADQAALLGILQKLYTLGLPLLLVRAHWDEKRSKEDEER
jgi:hypothetical protein